MTTSVLGRRAIPRQVDRASAVMGLYAALSVLWLISALLLSWELAAITEPETLLLCALIYYLRRGQPWARIVTWILFGLSALLNAVSLTGLLFTPSIIATATTLLSFVLCCAVCLWLAAPDSNEFFAARGLLTRGYDPAPVPAVRQQPALAPAPSAPGWYPATDRPNDQLYWDGTGWTARRRWTAAGYEDVGNPTTPPQAAAWQAQTAVRPVPVATDSGAGYRTAILLVALAVIPPVVAVVTVKVTGHFSFGPFHPFDLP